MYAMLLAYHLQQASDLLEMINDKRQVEMVRRAISERFDFIEMDWGEMSALVWLELAGDEYRRWEE